MKEDGDTLLVKYSDDADYRQPTPEELRAVKIEQTAQRLWERECYCCDSSLVDDLLKCADELPKGMNASEWSYDNIQNLQTTPDDWDYDQCLEWLSERGIGVDDEHMPHVAIEYDENYSGGNYYGVGETVYIREDKCDDWNNSEKVAKVFVDDTGNEPANIVHYSVDERVTSEGDEWNEDDAVDALREQIKDNAESAEVFEWWRVSEWMGKKLAKVGECVLDNAYGCWWGRCTTGQWAMMDGVIQKVAALIEK